MIRTLTPTLFIVFAVASAPFAQEVEAPEGKLQSRLSPIEEKKTSEEELETLRATIEQTQERQRRLAEEIAKVENDRSAINRALIETSKSAAELEARIGEQEQKLAGLASSRETIRAALSSKRAVLSDVLAALQRMGRNPPPAILVTPDDAAASVRSAILMGSVVPEIRSESATLLAELRTLAEIGRQIENTKQTLSRNLNNLAEDETRLSLLLETREEQAAQSRQQLEAERVYAEELARKATSLEQLIGQIEKQIVTARAAAQAAAAADAARASEEAARLKAAREALARGETAETLERKEQLARIDPRFADNGRIEPAIAFDRARGLLPRPVSGDQVHDFNSVSTSGLRRPNVGFAARANSRVRSPSDGWVVYAGPFRSYGHIVILNAGQDYRWILSGMEATNVRVGQFVLAGEPLGRMGLTRLAAATAANLPSDGPVLYVELRRGEQPVDPTPWWADEKEASGPAAAGTRKGTKNDS